MLAFIVEIPGVYGGDEYSLGANDVAFFAYEFRLK